MEENAQTNTEKEIKDIKCVKIIFSAFVKHYRGTNIKIVHIMLLGGHFWL